MKIWVAVVEDVVVQRREYIVFGDNKEEVASHIAKGLFVSESEAATVDTRETKIISTEEIGRK